MKTAFEQLGLDINIVKGLKKMGINEPTSIQTKAIPLALENKDIIGQSQTGTGKTLAYLLPLFQKIDTDSKTAQAIILAPTHELVMQIGRQVQLLSDSTNIPARYATIIGQANIKRQIEKLKEKPHIIIGTAGRIFELIKMKKIRPHTVKTIVIDEGDKLLDENNFTEVTDVIKTTMRDRQLLAFSATLNEDVLNIAKSLMKEGQVIKIKEEMPTNPSVTHMYFTAEQREKIALLRKLLASIKPEKAIVFINKSEETEITTLKLQHHHIKAAGIYGSVSKIERKKAMESFRNGKVEILVASDLAARGLDIQDVTHIFNLDLPEDAKEYLHRIGRTGRMGKAGTAISIVTKREITLIKNYAKKFNIHIEEKQIYKGSIIAPNRNKPKKLGK